MDGPRKLSLDPPASRRLRSLAGGTLVVASFLLWAPLPALAFLPLSLEHKAVVGAALVGSAEVAFWLGLVLAGPAVVQRLRARWKRNPAAPAGFQSQEA